MIGFHMMGALLLLSLLAAAALYVVRLKSRLERNAYQERDRLWEWFYGLDWGDVGTNNFGFAPAEGDGPERFQHQMYLELLRLAGPRARAGEHTDLLEISCGLGGGIAHLVRHWPGPVAATALDIAENALARCRRAYGDIAGLHFVQGSALALPFAGGTFDVVVNVEASHNYGDYPGFFREVHRVLRPGGLFLYCDSGDPEQLATVAQAMRQAGLAGEFRDITGNVVEACRLDSPRRLAVIRERAPWPYSWLLRKEVRNYAAVEGSRKIEAFRSRARIYWMTCAVRA
ncbi:MAG TPA: class I SAM-dependent methyltransferase [Allosphingosinicella sp.]|nr:class I SAM-dependent methyltransferase [Allosphingosinicella sp.]